MRSALNKAAVARILAIVLVLFLPFLPLWRVAGRAAGQSASLTLPQVRALAADNALDVLFAQRDRQVAELDAAILAADLRPQLRLNANFPNYLSSFRETQQPDGTVQFKPVQQNNSFVGITAEQALPWTGGSFVASTGLQRFDDFEAGSNTYNGSVVRVGYRQPLFGYNALKWRRQVIPARALEANATYRAARQQAALDATRLFFNVAAAEQAAAIADSNVLASTRLLDISQERYALGKISRGDLVQLELEAASARQDVLRARQQQLNATANLYDLIGADFSGAAVEVVVPPFAAVPDVLAEAALTYAQRNRPEAFAAERRDLEAADFLEQQRRNNGFQADFTASIGLIRSADELPEVYRDPQSEQIVELQLSVPILDWGRRRSLVRQAEAEVQLARQLGNRAQQSLDNQVRLAVTQFNQARRELELQESVRDLAEDRYQISRASYVLGAVPLTELTLARQARDQRAREYLGAQELAWIAYAQLAALTLHDFLTDSSL